MSKYVIVDLEMCKVPKAVRSSKYHWSSETIQIGAVLVDDNLEIIDEFNKLDREKLMRDRDYAMSNMCTKETVHLNHLKQQLGYANKMNSDELKKMITKNCTLFISNLKMFTNLFYPTLTDGITIWSRMTTFINMDIK